MKKLQQRLVALAMAGVMLVGHMYIQENNSCSATPTAMSPAHRASSALPQTSA